MKHTKEPWRTTELDRVISDTMEKLNDDYFIADCFGPDAKENARRIVLCVNYCAGQPDAVLELFPLQEQIDLKVKFYDEKEAIKAQRDELLMALKEADQELSYCLTYHHKDNDIKMRIKNLIAKYEASS